MTCGIDVAGEAVPLVVPLVADEVLGPRVAYGPMRTQHADPPVPLDAIVFPMRDDSLRRVTFEALDAIRAARGEYLPYRRQAVPYTRGEWVYVVEGSGWLEERHRYELGHYETSLLDRYNHYLFSFHDEFVEAIACGIWFDRPDPADVFGRPVGHPLDELPVSAATYRSTSSGIDWELRTNPAPIDQLIEASRLCSQRLLQYNLIGDGRSSEHASVWVRTHHEHTVSSFVTGFLGSNRADHDGVADPDTFAARWLTCVRAVASRRR